MPLYSAPGRVAGDAAGDATQVGLGPNSQPRGHVGPVHGAVLRVGRDGVEERLFGLAKAAQRQARRFDEHEGRVVRQNPLLEVDERRGRVETELLDEHLAEVVQRTEGVGLAAGSVEGERELGAERLSQRVLTDDPHAALAGADLAIVSATDGAAVDALLDNPPARTIDLSGRLGAKVEALPGYEGVGW